MQHLRSKPSLRERGRRTRTRLVERTRGEPRSPIFEGAPKRGFVAERFNRSANPELIRRTAPATFMQARERGMPSDRFSEVMKTEEALERGGMVNMNVVPGLVQRGLAKKGRGGRYQLTNEGREHLRNLRARWEPPMPMVA
jgi:hypothetical protein